MSTASEQLFERLCSAKEIRWNRIPESDQRLADYNIWPSKKLVIAEVKQLEMNKENKALIKAVQHGKEIPAGFRATGHIRLRNAIDNAYPQLKNSARGRYPSILIIYDNTQGLAHLGHDDILNAMYGDETIVVAWPEQEPAKSDFIAHRFGGQRRATPQSYRALSAIGLLQEATEHISLYLFHNVYANKPFQISLAWSLADRQFTIVDTENYNDWKEITR